MRCWHKVKCCSLIGDKKHTQNYAKKVVTQGNISTAVSENAQIQCWEMKSWNTFSDLRHQDALLNCFVELLNCFVHPCLLININIIIDMHMSSIIWTLVVPCPVIIINLPRSSPHPWQSLPILIWPFLCLRKYPLPHQGDSYTRRWLAALIPEESTIQLFQLIVSA